MQAIQDITDTGALLAFLDARNFPSEATKVLRADLNHSEVYDEGLSAFISLLGNFEQALLEKSRFHRQNVSVHHMDF